MKRNGMQPLPFQQWQANAGQVEEEEQAEVTVDEEETEEEEAEEPETEDQGEQAEPEETEESDEDDDEEVVVTIGDEAPPQEDEEERSAPKWVKGLRKAHRDIVRENRDIVRENRELKARLEQQATGAAQPQTPTDPGPKPTIDQFDYDADDYAKALEDWHDKKRKAEAHAAEIEAQQNAQQAEWQKRLDAYDQSKSKLKVRDYDEAEDAVRGVLTEVQQGIILQVADDSARVVYALGMRDERLKELASIKDPLRFASAIGKLEKDIKVTSKKKAPPPERKVSGTAPASGAIDKTLDRLRAEAEKTGDYSKVGEYKRELRRKKAG